MKSEKEGLRASEEGGAGTVEQVVIGKSVGVGLLFWGKYKN